MTKYEIIHEALQDKVNSGELTVEDAEILNDMAYEKYENCINEYTESGDDECMTYDEYLESMEDELFGEATRYAKEIHKEYNIARDKYKKLKNDINNSIKDIDDADEIEALKMGKYDMKAVKDMLKRRDSIRYGKKAGKFLAKNKNGKAFKSMGKGFDSKILQTNYDINSELNDEYRNM